VKYVGTFIPLELIGEYVFLNIFSLKLCVETVHEMP